MGKKIDLTGQRFGRLVITSLHSDHIKKRTMAVVVCDCGTTKTLRLDTLKNGNSKSCGCYLSDVMKDEELVKKRTISRKKTDLVEHTALSLLNQKTPSDNKSGQKGVCYVKRTGRWEAYLSLKGKVRMRENFDNKQDAINARKEAEDKYFKPILEKYSNQGVE